MKIIVYKSFSEWLSLMVDQYKGGDMWLMVIMSSTRHGSYIESVKSIIDQWKSAHDKVFYTSHGFMTQTDDDEH